MGRKVAVFGSGSFGTGELRTCPPAHKQQLVLRHNKDSILVVVLSLGSLRRSLRFAFYGNDLRRLARFSASSCVTNKIHTNLGARTC